MHNINVYSSYTGQTFVYRDFLSLTFTCFSIVFYGIFEQFHVQFFTTVKKLYLNFLAFLSLLNLRNSVQLRWQKIYIYTSCKYRL